MDDRSASPSLGERLRELDWSRGLTPTALVDRLPSDDPLRRVVGRHLPDATYFSPQDVLSALPQHAWAEAEATGWHDAGFPDAASGSAAPPSPTPEQTADPSAVVGEAAPTDAGTTGRVDQARRRVGQATQAATATAARVAAQAKERAGATSGAAIADLPDKVRLTAVQARDQVLNVRIRAADPPPASSSAPPVRRATPVALSAVIEGLGQAYNRQPVKSLAFGVLGLTLSIVSGLNTWLARRILRSRDITVGSRQVRPLLIGLWAATYAASLWDAWRNARADGVGTASPGAVATGSTWSALDPAGSTPSPKAASAATDEYPTVGSG